MIIVHACAMIIVRACTMIIVHACSMSIVHVCDMIIVHTRTMIIVHACAMSIVRACTMAIVHVSYPVRPVFLGVEAGGLGGEAPQVSRGVWGGARPPTCFYDFPIYFTKSKLFQNYLIKD